MNAYRDQYAKLFKNGRGVVLMAISADPDTALASWAHDSEFPFLFASDTGTAVARRYSLPRAPERGGDLASRPGYDQSQSVRCGTGWADRLSRDPVPGDRSHSIHG